jgi:hypothetical protein
MSQQIQNILVGTDLICTAALVLYFSFRSIQNLKDEYKDKWITAMNGFGRKTGPRKRVGLMLGRLYLCLFLAESFSLLS